MREILPICGVITPFFLKIMREEGCNFFMTNWKSLSADQKAARNAAILKYRHRHPEKVKQWRERYIVREADRIKARKEENHESE